MRINTASFFASAIVQRNNPLLGFPFWGLERVAVVESQTLLLENKSIMLQVPEDKQEGGGVRTTFEHTQSSSIANMSMAAGTAAQR